jgi:hypothetical protein
MPDHSFLEIKYKARFTGGDANNHLLEARTAGQSIEGLSLAMQRVIHYGSTGSFRSKGNFEKSSKIFISPPRRGSIIIELNAWVTDNPFWAIILGGYAMNTATPLINGLIGKVFSNALGITAPAVSSRVREMLARYDENELDQLSERIEPPLTRAHSFRGRTAANLELLQKKKEISKLTAETQAFLDGKIIQVSDTIDTNVTSYNVLTGNGRLYLSNIEKTIGNTLPFSLNANAVRGTSQKITESMRQYSRGNRGIIRLTAIPMRSGDGRLKKYFVSSAEELPQSDWIDGVDPLRSQRSLH